MKIFNWVHRKFNYKGGILTIGTFGFDSIKTEEKEYLYRDDDEEKEGEDKSDVSNESAEEEEVDEEEQELNPLMHAAYAHDFEDSICDNTAKGTIASDCDIKNMKKERITLADLFYADSDEQEKHKKNKGNIIDPDFNKKLSAAEANYKRGLSFAKKLVPRVGEDSRPIKKLHHMMTKMLKRKIHPDIGVKINKDNEHNTKPKVASEDRKIFESISLLQSQDAIM
ncbi:Hypothetical predicted protein [Olea europaea subsp. europaea]|uniref:Protein TILLER ANGLE CONTROL 1 n=1 Tax=Olea europaea subsp. europaea TaxID=158383 RepID=A0A8S0RRW7_OLEEU|nr:Hypothetical predicted protein [Olea europaea subsp. europaea]